MGVAGVGGGPERSWRSDDLPESVMKVCEQVGSGEGARKQENDPRKRNPENGKSRNDRISGTPKFTEFIRTSDTNFYRNHKT